MLLSIVVVTKDSSEDLYSTLYSISELCDYSVEVVVCEGGIANQSNEILLQFKFNKTLFIAGPDSGIYAGMNRGIKAATGEIVWFLNGGDKALDAIEMFNMAYMLSRLEYLWLIGKQLSSGTKPLLSHLPVRFYRELLFTGLHPIPHQSTLFKRQIFEQLGSFNSDIGISADQEYFLKLIELKYAPIFVSRELTIHKAGGVGDKQLPGSLSRQVQAYISKSSNLSRFQKFIAIFILKIFQFLQSGVGHLKGKSWKNLKSV